MANSKISNLYNYFTEKSIFVSYLIYLVTLLLCYINITVVEWDYYGFLMNDTSLYKLFLFMIPSLLPLIVFKKYKAPSDFAMLTLWLTVLTGSSIVMPQVVQKELTTTIQWLYLVSFCLIGMTIICRKYYNQLITEKKNQFSTTNIPKLVVPIFLIYGVSLSFYTLITLNFRFDISLETVYDRRLLARILVPDRSVFAYALVLQQTVVIPFICLIAASKRSLLLLLASIFFASTTFALTGQKSMVFQIIITYIAYLLFKKNRSLSLAYITIIMSILCLSAFLEFKFFNTTDTHNYLIRREVFIPGLLSSNYLDYFDETNFQYFKESLTRFGVEQKELPIGRLIGLMYFQDATTNANANIFANGYANLGFSGVILSAALGILVLCAINYLSMRVEHELSCITCLWCGLKWIDGSMHGSFLTGGIIFLMIGLILINYYNAKQSTKAQ